MLCQIFELVVLIFVVADVSIAVSVSDNSYCNKRRPTLCRPDISNACRHPRKAYRLLIFDRESESHRLAPGLLVRPTDLVVGHSSSRSQSLQPDQVLPSKLPGCFSLLNAPQTLPPAFLVGHPKCATSCPDMSLQALSHLHSKRVIVQRLRV